LSKTLLEVDENCLKHVLSDPVGWICYKYCQLNYPDWAGGWVEAKKQQLKTKEEDDIEV